jgi:hypothetical protein
VPLLLPPSIRVGNVKLLIDVHFRWRKAISEKGVLILELSLNRDIWRQLRDLLHEIGGLHYEQILQLRKHEDVFRIGVEPVTVDQFMIAARYEGRAAAISSCCSAFNAMVGELQISDEDRIFLQDWELKG